MIEATLANAVFQLAELPTETQRQIGEALLLRVAAPELPGIELSE